MARAEKQLGQQRGKATRSDMVKVTRRLFSEHGYHNTGIADIQEATGLTKGAFYHHFRSKEDLALAILEAAREDYAEQLIKPAMKHASPGARIEALLDGALALNARPQWCNCRLLATLSAELTAGDGRLRETMQAMQLSFFEMWRDLCAEARHTGEANDEIEPATAAQSIMNAMAGLVLSHKLGTAQVLPEKLVGLLKRTLLKRPPSVTPTT